MSEPVVSLLCLLTAGVSFLAFRNPELSDRLLFRPDNILAQKEWYRLFSSALIHADWIHLCFNLVALYSFGEMVEAIFGGHMLLLIYLASILGGSLLSLFLHRYHDYSALGASGGVCGVMFASIFLVPGLSVSLFLVPIGIPGPIFAGLYLVGTFVALRKGVGNLGHDAHFGGAIVGLLLALAMAPENCFASPVLFSSAFLFSAFCLFVLARDPMGISGTVFSFGTVERRSNIRYQRYDEARARNQEQEEIDRILDKIATRGMDSLSERERAKLHNASSKIRRG
jgi:membrane associated rhomboid family serine protease